mmetsp:Transcript_8102/g.20758  ORF Transcript_8102/g.20758 Transcript_8102/m.20758 type:complete len:89 (+) Transcript_8102:472-738(+)
MLTGSINLDLGAFPETHAHSVRARCEHAVWDLTEILFARAAPDMATGHLVARATSRPKLQTAFCLCSRRRDRRRSTMLLKLKSVYLQS